MIENITIYSEADAAKLLRDRGLSYMEEKTLRNLRYRHKIGHLRRGFYREEHLEEFIQSQDIPCAENQSSSNVVTPLSGSSTSRKKANSERCALARARQIIA